MIDDGLFDRFPKPEVILGQHVMPPRAGQITYDQARGFTLWATRSILSGHGDEVLEVAKSNLRELAVE